MDGRSTTENRDGAASAGAVRRGWFVLRLWHEPGDGWRGHVTHVQTGTGAFFRRRTRLWRFVETALGLLPGDALLAPGRGRGAASRRMLTPRPPARGAKQGEERT